MHVYPPFKAAARIVAVVPPVAPKKAMVWLVVAISVMFWMFDNYSMFKIERYWSCLVEIVA